MPTLAEWQRMSFSLQKENLTLRNELREERVWRNSVEQRIGNLEQINAQVELLEFRQEAILEQQGDISHRGIVYLNIPIDGRASDFVKVSITSFLI